ncbi:conserved hypothetical protein [Desulfamplus magnetovallimortis]|uniref:Uncharacterized protein n=1 Tax=Desulfamplus magnetovallimortis TaxID=1246637 RepID=A0A1W1HJL1_9BACT|nr:DUF5320 domain-containing protein [Desulfamplus magnetovallimortis]SLM32595.1 conserved hypothetical protein [Desulfamplus magnetovallimortis]
MPGFNGQGPMSQGSMTGGGRGYCRSSFSGIGRSFAGGSGRGYGQGMNMGYGNSFNGGRCFAGGRRRGGMGRGAGFIPGGGVPYEMPYTNAPDPATEIEMLKRDAEGLQNHLDMIKKRMSEIDEPRQD